MGTGEGRGGGGGRWLLNFHIIFENLGEAG